MKALIAPLLLGMTIVEQSSHFPCDQTGAVIDESLTGTSHQANSRLQFELAGGVIATVADHAAFSLQFRCLLREGGVGV